MTRPANGPSRIEIRPPAGHPAVSIRELWESRDLLYFLVWRDVKVRYKQTVLGAAWAVFQPLVAMVVFTLFFGRLAQIPSDGVPYPLFSYVALLPWTYVAQATTQATNSLVGSANLITKVYFPRLVIPISAVIGGLLDFAIAVAMLAALMLYYGFAPTAATPLVVVFLALAVAVSLGVGAGLSALNVKYRDVHHALPFFTQIWLFVTPVVYPSSLVPEPWRTVMGINPMAGVVEGFRWALLGTLPPKAMLGLATLSALVVLASGLVYFQRVERGFADVV